MTTTITHDPDGSRGCNACPFFHGVSWAGECRALPDAEIASASSGRFAPDPDCPLRNGGVNVRGPETVPADHHEPTRGDAVPVEAVSVRAAAMHEAARRIGAVLDGERRPARASEPTLLIPTLDRAEALSAGCAVGRAEFASIATALGMDPGALDGAIVERVEMLVRERDGWREASDIAQTERDAFRAEVRALRGSTCTVAESNAVATKYIAERDTALDAARQTREERDAHKVEVERLTRERDEAVATLEALRAKRGGVADERERYITELEAGAAEVRAALGATDDETTLDAARRAREERDAQRVEVERLTRERDEARGEAAAYLRDLNAEMDGAGKIREALGARRDETMWSLVERIVREREIDRLYLARAIRGCDFKKRRAIEADLRAEGVTPPGVLVSAEDAAVVRTVLVLAAKVSRGDGDAGHSLQRAVLRWRAAGRPLASEGGE